MSETMSLRNYFMLRGALLRQQRLPWQLSEEQQAALLLDVMREEQLVVRALASPDASAVHLEDAALRQAVELFMSGMASLGEVKKLLNEAGLQQESLAAAIGAEMRAATVLDRLTAAVAPTEEEVYRWYQMKPGRFVVPERREVFQILITVNELYPENRHEAALRRISELELQAKADPATFKALALRHSECPSAVEGGRLGVMPSGHLYPALDRELFAMESGAISGVVESPLGFHLLRCGVIEPSRQLAWGEVKESLMRRLAEQKSKRYLQQWLAGG